MNSASSYCFDDLFAAPLTMSSLEIAALTGKQHKHVLRDIRELLTALVDAALDGPHRDHGRFPTITWSIDACSDIAAFRLPKYETQILFTRYSTKMNARLRDRWMRIETAVAAARKRFAEATE